MIIIIIIITATFTTLKVFFRLKGEILLSIEA
jgi:hypothetical protein